MNEERILAEIDVAHRMGIDVFVLDAGWFEKTGDWQVSRKRFPNGLGPVKARLDRYGMKLGLWFDPLAAAVSSRMAQSPPRLRAVVGRPALRAPPGVGDRGQLPHVPGEPLRGCLCRRADPPGEGSRGDLFQVGCDPPVRL